MKWSDLKTAVKELIPVDAARINVGTVNSGVSFVDRQIRQCALDLQHFIDFYRIGHQTTFGPDDVTPNGECSQGILPDGMLEDAWLTYAGAGKLCCDIPVMAYPWENRADLVCGNVRSIYQNVIAIDPRGRDFFLYPLLEDEMNLRVNWDGKKADFADADETSFEEDCIQAFALWVTKQVAQYIDRDVDRSKEAWRDYLLERQKLFVSKLEIGQLRRHGEPMCSWMTCSSSESPDSSKVHFCAVGDVGEGNATELSVANLINGFGPDFILFLGDVNYPDGNPIDFEQKFLNAYDLWVPDKSYNAWSNHDLGNSSVVAGQYGGSLLSLYPNIAALNGGKLYYDVVMGDGILHLFVINSGYTDGDPREPDGITEFGAQAAWLQAKLAASSAAWKVVVFHRPPHTSDVTYYPGIATLRWPFKAWGADLLLCGHTHTYERLLWDGLPIINSALGASTPRNFNSPVSVYSQFRYNTTHGALRLVAETGRLQAVFYNINGDVVDNVTYSKG